MKAVICDFSDKYFGYLSDNEKNEIKNRVKNKTSFCFLLYDDNGKDRFSVVIDIDNESVHLRHAGGKYMWRWKYIENLCVYVCRLLKLNKITLLADQKHVIYGAKRLGYKNEGGNMYGKVI